MADKHDPSKKSLQRWANEGGAPKGGRAKRPRDPNQLAKSIIGIATGEIPDREPTPEEQGKTLRRRRQVAKGVRHERKSSVTRIAKRLQKKAARSRWSKKLDPL